MNRNGKSTIIVSNTTTTTKNNNNIPALYIDNNPILQCSSVNLLGVTINKSLNWKEHIKNRLLKLHRNTGLMRRLKYSLLQEMW